MKTRARKATIIDATSLLNQQKHHPTPRPGRAFGATRLPQTFQTVIDPTKHPLQPWRDLPPPTGAPPFHLSLDSILSADAMNSIETSGTMVFHSVGDTGGVNTPS